MKITAILMLTVCLQVSATSFSQTITFTGNNLPLKKVFAAIKSQTGYVVWGKSDLIRQSGAVSVHAVNMPLDSFLGLVLKDQPIEYEISDKTIILSPAPAKADKPDNFLMNAAEIPVPVRGKIVNAEGSVLTGANIRIKGTARGTVTDAKGTFEIEVEKGATLEVSLIGYTSRELQIKDNSFLTIVLKEDYQQLDEIIAIGYGTMRKSDLTGAVASVKADQLNTIPVGNAMEALAGKVAGVNVGSVVKPGQSPTVTVRGQRSINADNTPLFVVDGIPRSTIDDIPVDEIQSIEVLKDAVSTAIYGSRGANGVIMVATKSGVKGKEKTTIDLDAYYGINAVNLPQFMDGETFVQFRRDAARFAAYGAANWSTGAPLTDEQVFAPQELPNLQSKTYTDWKSLLYNKTTNVQEYNLSVSNSGIKSQSRFSVGYRNDEGYYPGSKAQRLTLGLKLDQQLFSFLQFGINVRYSNKVENDADPGVMMGSGNNSYDALYYLNPLIRAYDENGQLIENVVNIYANPLLDYTNPYTDRTTRNRLFSLFSLRAKIAKGLTFTSNFGYDYENRIDDVFYGKNTTKRYIVRDSEGAFASKRNRAATDITWDNILNYTIKKGDHDINATAVSSIQGSTARQFEASGTGLPDDVLGNWNMEQLQSNILNKSAFQKSNIASVVARFQYGFKERYLFNASLRSDGASVLSEGNKWATFPAASLGWVISKESFYNSAILTSLKLRLSYGSVGNAAIKPYETLAGVDASKTNFGNQFVTGYSLSGLVNKQLGWEISKTANVGVDWALFGGRISGYIDAYRTYTSDLLFKRSLPNLTGSTEIWQNIGASSNTGIELMVNSINVNTRDFTWRTDLNFSTNRPRIEKLITNEDMLNKLLFIGKPWNIYYDNVVAGIWQVDEAAEAAGFATFPGFTRLMDISGPEGKPDGSVSDVYDRIIHGQRDPKWSLYMRNTWRIKRVSIGMALNGNFGHVIQMSGNGFNSFYPLNILSDYWTPDRPEGKYPLISNNATLLNSYWRLRKGDNINVQEISLSYSLRVLNLQDINISMQARNPFFLYKAAKDTVDPSAPNSDWTTWKSYVIKVSLNF